MLPKTVLVTACMAMVTQPPAQGQVHAGATRAGGAAGISGRAGIIPGSGIRASQGFNPAFHPPGSWSTYQTLNPRGSLSTSAVRNPPGSYFHPPNSPQTDGIRRLNAKPERTSTFRVPTVLQLQATPRQDLPRWVRGGAHQLSQELNQYANGPAWQEFLRIDTILIEFGNAQAPEGLDSDQQKRAQQILAIYDAVAKREDLRPVNQMAGFLTVRNSLRTMLQAPYVVGVR